MARLNHPLSEALVRHLGRLNVSRTILAAVSGGADSMALMRSLVEVRDKLGLSLHVAHLNHQLRGQAARDDANWLAEVCRSLDVPVEIGQADIAVIARDTGRGIEETARDERYRFLEETAQARGCRAIALAHTADDQAETILHHILRGTGIAGLRGIPHERELASGMRLVRPLLDISRETVLDYLSQIGQDFRHDKSNQDETYTRNRIRLQLLPLLANEYNPQVRDALRRLGSQAADLHAALEDVAGSLLERVFDSADNGECRVKWQPLCDSPRHLVREVFALAWRRHDWPRQSMAFEHWDQLAEIALHGGTMTLPGNVDARREGRWLVLRRGAGTS